MEEMSSGLASRQGEKQYVKLAFNHGYENANLV